jgi:uncharacterized protein (UPF0332 family)
MDPNLFYALASSLAAQGGPAECRTAVSRAYYSAHHAGIRFLKAIGLRPASNASSHAAVFHALLNGGDQEIKSAGSELSSLHGRRNDADYELDNAVTENQILAKTLVQQAWNIILALQNCRNDNARLNNVKSAIQGWIKKVKYDRLMPV